MSNNIGQIRSTERKYLANDGKLDKTEAAELVALAKNGTAQDKAAVKEILERDRFDKGIDVQQLAKAAGIDGKIRQNSLVGSRVGAAKEQVTRVLGDAGGYGSKFQAIAAARLSMEAPVAVVEKGGRFYAVQTSAEVKSPSKGTTPVAALNLKAYEDLQNDKPEKLSPEAKYRKLAAMAYGVPETDIHVYNSTLEAGVTTKSGLTNQPDVNKINVDLGMPPSKNGTEGHGPGQCSCHGAVNGKPTAISVGPHLLDRGPMRAATTLFHEGQHNADRILANKLYAKLGKYDPTNAADVKRAQKLIFEDKTLDPSQRAAMYQQFGLSAVSSGTSTEKHLIEARAYAAAVAHAAEHDPKGMVDQVIGLGAELNRGGQFDPGAKSFKQLVGELRAVYETLPQPAQEAMRKAIEDNLKGKVKTALLDALPKP